VYTNLYSFTDGWDGGAPNAALVQGPNGNFYGTSQGSTTLIIETNSIGTVFEITPSGSLTTLYSFTDGCDGANPTAGLVLGTDGSFYGAADAGGTIGWGEPTEEFGRILGGNLGWGTIFNITPDGFLTPLCEFTGGSEGANPGAGLIQAANGLLYGVTERGGTNDDGTVFQMGLDGTVTTLYSFTGGADGAVPLAALTPGSDGNFYGTTYGGGSGGVGAVFMITPAGLLTPLHTFANGADGSHPMASLVQGTNGSLYGTTVFGGAGNGAGTVFEITPGGGFATLYTFKNGSDGGCPEGLALGPDGQFYGVADGGGVEGNGTVFRITTAGVFTNLYSFKDGADGAGPSGALTLGRDGNFYGVCSAGGSNQYSQYGTVFKITTAGSLTPLYSFTGTNDGVYPQGPLTLGADGNFYGTTASGANGYGTVFQITTNGALTTLHWFTWLENGLEGYSAVAQATNGNFYIACEGMSETSGTVLRMVVPPVLLPVETTGKAALLKWAGQPGQKYQVQYSGSLAPANWTNLGPPMVAAGCLSQCTNAPPSASQGFYRVAVLP
jgi:uncharacterized repeat protein (TIGR03803 family)